MVAFFGRPVRSIGTKARLDVSAPYNNGCWSFLFSHFHILAVTEVELSKKHGREQRLDPWLGKGYAENFF